MNNKI